MHAEKQKSDPNSVNAISIHTIRLKQSVLKENKDSKSQ